MSVFVNRTLNLNKIKIIGFDMDYTLVRYNVEEFEKLTHSLAKKRLVSDFGYPESILNLEFDFNRAIIGLVIDKRNGNLLKMSRYGKVKISYHGLELIDHKTQQDIYQDVAIELRAPEFKSLDTSFAISYGVLFSQIVQMKKDGISLPAYNRIADDVNKAIDMVHRDGSLKTILVQNIEKYVILDPLVPALLERYKDYGKTLMIITNSDYNYTKLLLDYALNSYWKKYKRWEEVFDLTITFADKPRFFEQSGRFLKIDPVTGAMNNYEGPITTGIFQGGYFGKLQSDMNFSGKEILYLGDHIYGDVVSIKKRCNWRTALVMGDLEEEVESVGKSRDIQDEIDSLMIEKSTLEEKANQQDILRYRGEVTDPFIIEKLFEKMDELNERISLLLSKYRNNFNPYWGEVFRSGYEESRYAEQVEKYACIYMTKVSDLYNYSPKNFFRPVRSVMPHERI